ncbi:hypothetical protein VM57_08210 [Stenotrophomonas maltophilia]|uniref:Uncharacterized protein n=1 Tax=Stenotrophomonas maltophilia TaxID=40324 RepID=A0A0F5ZQX5_STEMA|nr:hypothetical protein VM57_08210 [Stenotrophomonas maltophilia]
MALQAKDRKLLMTAQAGNPGGPIVAMASGRAFAWGNYGDGMMGIFLNEQEPGIESMTWSINDIFSGAERRLPSIRKACSSIRRLTALSASSRPNRRTTSRRTPTPTT